MFPAVTLRSQLLGPAQMLIRFVQTLQRQVGATDGMTNIGLERRLTGKARADVGSGAVERIEQTGRAAADHGIGSAYQFQQKSVGLLRALGFGASKPRLTGGQRKANRQREHGRCCSAHR